MSDVTNATVVGAALDSLGEALLVVDGDGLVVHHNRAALSLFGYERREMVDLSIDALLGSRLDEGTARDLACRRKDGVTFSSSLTPIPALSTGSGVRAYVVREAIPRDESHLLAAIVDSASDAIVRKSLDGTIESWNSSAERIFGYAAGEAMGQNVSMLIPDALQAEESAILERIRHGERVESYESRRVRNDGRLIDVRLTVSPVRDRNGVVVGASKIVTDLSSQRRSELQFKQLLETAPDAMILAESDGRIWLANSQVEHMFGYARDELVGRPVEVLMPERFRSMHVRHKTGYIATPRVRAMGDGLDLYGLRRDGSEFPIEVSLAPLETDEGIVISTAIRDITERKRGERLIRASLEEKEILLKEVHHRVKNNLAVIGSLFYLQSMQATDPGLIAMMRDSQDRVRSMAMVHESLYNADNLTDVDFAEYARNLCEQLVTTYSVEGQITLVTSLGAVPLSIDLAVPCGLILNELVTNAVKHAFPQGRKGCISLSVGERDGEVTVQVLDDGVGLPEGFDLSGGTSLGLRLIRSLSGQIDGRCGIVDTTAGTLATVTFALPTRELAV